MSNQHTSVKQFWEDVNNSALPKCIESKIWDKIKPQVDAIINDVNEEFGVGEINSAIERVHRINCDKSFSKKEIDSFYEVVNAISSGLSNVMWRHINPEIADPKFDNLDHLDEEKKSLDEMVKHYKDGQEKLDEMTKDQPEHIPPPTPEQESDPYMFKPYTKNGCTGRIIFSIETPSDDEISVWCNPEDEDDAMYDQTCEEVDEVLQRLFFDKDCEIGDAEGHSTFNCSPDEQASLVEEIRRKLEAAGAIEQED